MDTYNSKSIMKEEVLMEKSESEDFQNDNTSFNHFNETKRIHKRHKKKLNKNNEDEPEFLRVNKVNSKETSESKDFENDDTSFNHFNETKRFHKKHKKKLSIDNEDEPEFLRVKKVRSEEKSESEDFQNDNTSFNHFNETKRIHKRHKKKLNKNNEDEPEFLRVNKVNSKETSESKDFENDDTSFNHFNETKRFHKKHKKKLSIDNEDEPEFLRVKKVRSEEKSESEIFQNDDTSFNNFNETERIHKKHKKKLNKNNEDEPEFLKVKKVNSKETSESKDFENDDTSFNHFNETERIHKRHKKKLNKNNEDEPEFSRVKKVKSKETSESKDLVTELEKDNDSTDLDSDTSSILENDTITKKRISYSFTLERLNDKSCKIEELENDLDSFSEMEDTLSREDRMKLKKLNIKLIHEVPKQHMIGRFPGSRGLNDDEKELFLKYGPLRRGTFSVEEDNIIKENWKMFCKLHDWNEDNVKPFLSPTYNGKYYIPCTEERKKFVQFLANGLLWRHVFSVYQRFKTLYQTQINQRYTISENKIIMDYVKRKEKENLNKNMIFLNLSKILKRRSTAIGSHYDWLTKRRYIQIEDDIFTKPILTLSLIKRFVNELLRIMKCDCIEELKNAIIPKFIWIKLGKKLNINYKRLKYIWVSQLHMQLFCPDFIYINDIKIQLIEYMYIKGISSKREIIWSDIIKYFDGTTSFFLNRIFVGLMNDSEIKECEKKSFIDAIECLYEKKIPEIQNYALDKYLPRIKYTIDDSI
ncbi:PREDICTED: uncharacterized protein PFB0145c-like [Polistes dominula]|uniref:Uncharacterized protein PFB0145c-like n=1 Tax=Polistes dominula TaxID=743375 RepID=A0ABM1J057_POLDO|nr:PREDICTED: uncharacterized protein PFB0145c-like [Polistes dominula]